SLAGHGNPASTAGGSGAGLGAGNSATQPNPDRGAGKSIASKSGPANGADTGNDAGSGNQRSTEHISLPRDGQFGAVVVGASLDQKYPEASGILSGRLA